MCAVMISPVPRSVVVFKLPYRTGDAPKQNKIVTVVSKLKQKLLFGSVAVNNTSTSDTSEAPPSPRPGFPPPPPFSLSFPFFFFLFLPFFPLFLSFSNSFFSTTLHHRPKRQHLRFPIHHDQIPYFREFFYKKKKTSCSFYYLPLHLRA